MPGDAISLHDAIARVAAKDRSAFEILYRATSAKLYGVILRILRNKAVADDVLQDVYVSIWERAGSFDPTRGSPLGWMATIARNRALDEIRKKKTVATEDIESIAEPAAEFEHPLDKTERREDLAKLMRCLSGLEPGRREIILLAYCQGATREALATKFATPAATIKSWLRRSLMQLKVCLES